MFDSSSTSTYRAHTMRRMKVQTVRGLMAAVFVAVATNAGAQEQPPTPPTDDPTPTEAPASPAPSSPAEPAPSSPADPAPSSKEAPSRSDAQRSDELELRLRSVNAGQLTNDEKKVNVEKLLSKQRTGLSEVTDLTAEARARKDIVQLNCVNAKRTQLKGLLKLSQQAASSLYEGMATGAEDTVNHEYTKIAVASQRAQLLGSEAKQCVGEEAIFAGDTDVTVEIDDSIPVDDPTLPAAPPLGPAAPPVASGF